MIRRNTFFIFVGIAIIIMSAIIFLFTNVIIPNNEIDVRQKLRIEIDINAMPSKNVPILKVDKLDKNTVITEEVMNDFFYMLDIPEIFLIANYIEDLKSIKNMVLTETIYKNQQVSLNILKNKKEVFNDGIRLSAFKLFGIEAFNAKEGNIVDILVIYENGSYDIVVPKTTIENIEKDSNENENYIEDSFVFGFFALEEKEYSDLELASNVGVIEIRTYLDSEQKASIKTFEFDEIMEE